MTQSHMWMGKQLGLDRPRGPEGLADIVGSWVAFSLSHYTRKPLQRLLGRIGWVARPGFSAGCFLVGARAWLRLGPPSAHWVPFAVCRGLLAAIAAGSRGRDRSRLNVRQFVSTPMQLLVRARREGTS